MSEFKELDALIKSIRKNKNSLEGRLNDNQKMIRTLQQGIEVRSEQIETARQLITENTAWNDAARKEIQQRHQEISTIQADLLELQEQLVQIDSN